MRALSRAVVASLVGLGQGKQIFVGRLGGIFSHLLLQQLGFQREGDVLAVLLFGHAHRVEGIRPSLVGVVIGTHGVNILAHFGLIGVNVQTLAPLLHQLLINVSVDHLLANALGSVVVLSQPLAPGLLLGQTHLGTNVLHCCGNRVFLNLGAVNGSGHAARIGRTGAVSARLRTTGNAHGAHSGQSEHGNRLGKGQLLHTYLPSRRLELPASFRACVLTQFQMISNRIFPCKAAR